MTDVRIGSIRIRADNFSPEEGRQLGARVGALLSAELASGAGARRDVGLLQARAIAQPGQTVEQVAAEVVTAILGAM